MSNYGVYLLHCSSFMLRGCPIKNEGILQHTTFVLQLINKTFDLKMSLYVIISYLHV